MHRSSRAKTSHYPCLAPKLVFVHVPKTAGTSAIEWIQRHYSFSEILFEASQWSELRDLFQTRSADWFNGKRFIRGHFGSYIVKFFSPTNGYRYVTVLRDPVERTISNFWHIKRSPDAGLYHLVKHHQFQLENFLEHPLTRPYASNYQVRNFAYELDRDYGADLNLLRSNLVFPGDIGAAELTRAKSFLSSIDAVGFSEDLSGFVNALSNRFGFFTDDELGKYRSYRNESESISPALLDKIRDLNRLDIELYEWARARFTDKGRAPERRWRALYGWAEALYSFGRKRDHFSTPGKPIPMTNPLDFTDAQVAHWHAKEPLFGTGWSDVQSPDSATEPPHRWTVRKPDAKINVYLKEGERYLLVFDVFRFVTDEQIGGFSLLVDGEKVDVTGPAKTELSGPGGGIFVADLGRRTSDECRLTFRVDTLRSFQDVNSEDTDDLPRGLALSSMTFVIVKDDDGASPRKRAASKA